jgi:2-C-methyl-D-erythritol 4-phosphate cytidylyltransferase
MSHGDADSPHVLRQQIWSIVVAGGSGLRFGSRKQFADLRGQSVLQRAIAAASSVSGGVVVVVPADAVDSLDLEASDTEIVVVAGGNSRAASVREGLTAVPEHARFVLVHDAARPLASPELFTSVLAALSDGASAVVPVVAVSDTIRSRADGVIDRNQLVAVQTPQGFAASTLREAHASGDEATDDATLVEAIGEVVKLVDGEVQNRKLTEPIDLAAAAAVLDYLEEHR